MIGSAGQLGTEVYEAFCAAGHDVLPLSHAEIEVTDPTSVRKALRSDRLEAVVNCAAYVRVDEAEDDGESAFRVNALGALNVARVCRELDALCIYLSTDYVFDGEKTVPYTEMDPPRPINVYGASKLAGEYLVRQACPKWTIVRVAGVFGSSGARAKDGNFIEGILVQARAGSPLRVVHDTRISPTYARDAAATIVQLAQQSISGIVHVANSDFCTWYGLAKKVMEICRLNAFIEPVSSDAFPRKAARPHNSALNNALAEEVTGRPLPPWEDAVRRYLECQGYIK
ncbi:MAG: dTDP-4-dehydrorhamnose reductase [Alphaproteobacteria bacterium]